MWKEWGECRRRHSPFFLPVPAGQKVTGKPGGRLSNRLKHKHDPNGKSSQLFFRVIYGELWYITITEREKARTAKIRSRRKCRFKSCRGHQHTAPWCRWLTCLPVTQKIAGSSPVGAAIRPLSLTVEHRFKNRALFMALYVNRQTGGLSLRRCGFKSRQSRQMLPGSGRHPFKVTMPVRARQGSPPWALRLIGQDAWFSARRCEFKSHRVLQQRKSTASNISLSLQDKKRCFVYAALIHPT